MADKSVAEQPLLKDLLGEQALATIASAGRSASDDFDAGAFLRHARDGLGALSIMERVRHIADALKAALPGDYSAAMAIVRAMGPHVKPGFQGMALAEFPARHGLGDVGVSLEALADLTRFGSAEFAIRPFLARDPSGVLEVMLRWSGDKNEHVRRLASEGSRPRLPWAARVPALKGDPTLAAPILEALKADPSAYVRKSVANHLNDVTRERPLWVLDTLEHWRSADPATIWITKHALRTLIKKGDPRALALLGVEGGARIDVTRFSVSPVALALGGEILLSADLVSTADREQKIVADYRILYARAGGRVAAKVFKLKTFTIPAGATASLAIRQPIRDFSTRRHHPGRHEVELILNGETMAASAFDLRPAA